MGMTFHTVVMEEKFHPFVRCSGAENGDSESPQFFPWNNFFRSLFPETFYADCLILGTVAVLFGVFYLMLAFIFRAPELKEFFSILRRKKKKSA